MNKNGSSKSAKLFSDITISSCVILLSLWLIAEDKIGLDNYIGDHSLNLFWLPWWLILIFIPIFLTTFYYIILILTEEMGFLIGIILRSTCIFALLFLTSYLADLTAFPSSFDYKEFSGVLWWFLIFTGFTIVIQCDIPLKEKLEEKIENLMKKIAKQKLASNSTTIRKPSDDLD